MLHRLAVQNLLDVVDRARRLNRRTREDRESLLGRVQHLLDVGHDASDVRGNKGVVGVERRCRTLQPPHRHLEGLVDRRGLTNDSGKLRERGEGQRQTPES